MPNRPMAIRSITIQKPAEELFALWQKPETFRQIMGHIAELTRVNDGTMHFRARAALGQRLEWDLEPTEVHEPSLLRYRARTSSGLVGDCKVTFQPSNPAGRGTVVTLKVRLELGQANLSSKLLARWNMTPRVLTERVLYNFKTLVEAGEIPSTQHNPSGRSGSRIGRFLHASSP